MLLTDLPPELHQIITNNIPDRASLCSLLRTCHSLYFEAERSLYHTFDDIRSLKRQVLFLQRVTECPRLARLVRVYRIQPAPPGSEALMTFCGTPSSSSLYIPSSTARLFWTLLPIAFHLFVNLRVLALHSSTPYDGGAAILPTSRFLRGCSFQLGTLEWGWYTPNEPRDLLPFLATQQHLRNISLRGWDAETFPGPAEYSSRIHQIHQHHPAHSDSAVHTKDNTQQITRRSTSHSQDFAEESDSESYHCGLSVLTGPQGAVKAFLPGHKITHLRWLADLDDPWCEGPGFDPDSPELISSFKQIKFLKFGAWFARPSLGILAPYLGQLIFLELTDVDKEECGYIRLLSSLKLLRISQGPRSCRNFDIALEGGDRDALILASEFFRNCTTLQTVDIAADGFPGLDGEGEKGRMYSRWNRGVELVERVTIHDEWPDVIIGRTF